MNLYLQWTHWWLCQLMKQSMLGKPGTTWKKTACYVPFSLVNILRVCWPCVGFSTYFQHSKLQILILFWRRSTPIFCTLWMYMRFFFSLNRQCGRQFYSLLAVEHTSTELQITALKIQNLWRYSLWLWISRLFSLCSWVHDDNLDFGISFPAW